MCTRGEGLFASSREEDGEKEVERERKPVRREAPVGPVLHQHTYVVVSGHIFSGMRTHTVVGRQATPQ